MIFRNLPIFILNLGNFSVITTFVGFFQAVSVLLTKDPFVPETLHHNLTVLPSLTVYSGFIVPIITGGSEIKGR